MTKEKRLGRGLDALLSKPVSETSAIMGAPDEADALRHIAIDLLQRGKYQPRLDMRTDKLQDLAESIKSQGLVQPIVVRPTREGLVATQRYEIIAGERRWRAAQMAGLQKIPAVVKNVSDKTAIAMSLIENIQRENLNPLEEARALNRLIEEFGLTHKEGAEAVGRSRASVSNLLRLLELSDKVKVLVESREIEMGHARALLGIADKLAQYELARQIISKGLSVRQTERLVRQILAKEGSHAPASAATQDRDIGRLEKDITGRLGAKVKINHTQKGRGKLIISYNNLDELDGILKHIK